MFKKRTLSAIFFFLILFAVFAHADETQDIRNFYKLIDENNVEGLAAAIHNGFDINRFYLLDKHEHTPLIYAINHVKPDIVKALLDLSADVNYGKQTTEKPLFYAIIYDTSLPTQKLKREDQKNTEKILDLLLAYGANVNADKKDSSIPLNWAVSGFDFERALAVTKKLIDAGASVNPNMKNVPAPLFWAVWQPELTPTQEQYVTKGQSRARIVQLLLQSGADPNTKYEGYTPLHIVTSTSNRDYESAKALLDAGANPEMADNDGHTPLDVARLRNDSEMVRLLMQYMKR